MTAQIAPYGSWTSPLTADLIVQGGIGLSQLSRDGEDLYWVEMRPAEGGRNALMRWSPTAGISEVLPGKYNVRTRVHEYGGGAYLAHEGVVYFSNYRDQRLYRLALGGEPVPLTPEIAMRYADYVYDPIRACLFLVREDHTGAGEAVNTLVRLPTINHGLGSGTVIVEGYDFFSNPRLNPRATHLCWLCWNHPNMPWDGCELWIGELDKQGEVVHKVKVAGGKDESIFQPRWSPDGELYFISDRSGYWNLYRLDPDGPVAIYPRQVEFGLPQWVFGLSTYDFASRRSLVCTWSQSGITHLELLDLVRSGAKPIALPYTELDYIQAAYGSIFALAGSPTEPWSIIRIDLKSSQVEVLRSSRSTQVDPAFLPVAEPIEFETENGLTAHGFFYAPKNPDYRGPGNEKPPLVVMSHGGPTGQASAVYKLNAAYYTSRGLAVLDVDYGGSTGYGRLYRQRLNGNWGIVDVDDCVNGALHLVKTGLVDGNRLAIRGGSAGGYTTLAALAFRDVFHAGASHFGIGDLEALAQDTHKFEARYEDNLIGPYPEARDLYLKRSPIHHVDQLNCALILFQGLEDPVVPPAQSEMMYLAVKAKGLPVAYLPFDGEQHGFRKAENMRRSLEAEYYFFARVFGFTPAGDIEPVKIENLDEG